MSVLPKKTIRGSGVTIHFGIKSFYELGKSKFIHSKIQVKRPDGVITSIFDDYYQVSPYEKTDYISSKIETKKGLTKSIPYLILADYISNYDKTKEVLLAHFDKLKDSKHFYFYYDIPDNAPLGKYELITETYINGVSYGSVTKDSDFFLVEEVTINNINVTNNMYDFTIKNNSPEKCEVIIVEYFSNNISRRNLSLNPFESKHINSSEDTCIFYNELRETITIKPNIKVVFRNPKYFHINKIENKLKKIYVMDTSENAYILEGNYIKIWEKSDGSKSVEKIREIDPEKYKEMIKNKLIIEI